MLVGATVPWGMEPEERVSLDTWGGEELPEFWVGRGTILPEPGGWRTGPSGEDMEAGGECKGRECVVAVGRETTGGCGELEVEPRPSREVLFPRYLCRPAM